MRAIDNNLIACSVCHQLLKYSPKKDKNTILCCPRCKSKVQSRRHNSIQQTWALVIASIIFIIPANLLPMMHVDTFAGSQSDTIMSGVIYFIQSGSWPIALVIFVASIFVPVLKIMILLYLLISVQLGSCKRHRQRKRLYVLTEFIGRWSMVDIYVVAVMVALVYFKGITTIHAGTGANYFMLVVICTMVAAMRFDPRLIWDIKECKEKDKEDNEK